MENTGTKGNYVQALKRLFTELPTSCFGESLKLGVLRIAELSSVISVGGVIGFFIVLVKGGAGVGVPLVGLLWMAVQLTCSLLLFIGVVNGNVMLMKPWFWLNVVVGCLFFILGTLALIAVPFLQRTVHIDLVYTYGGVIILCAVMRYSLQAVYALMMDYLTSSADKTSHSDDKSSTKGSCEYDLDMNLDRD